ncbi:capsule biosynthesis protein [Salinicola rhizosphaerae]|uniref:Capsular polysaccharide export protein n=1 Tax=Salinicola rhizosphaerae TaxID=1443141 RepID=A0ABQ3DR84_9GAMM|nr:capsular biosynthesis protein [Salinicola rhizosphaerae]GHB11331.1 capsular polysaccharide export protein [Salinicola rhizosphaerae]
MSKSGKHFLLMQGVCSPFFNRLGEQLRDAGHAVTKVNFTVGDSAYWHLGDTCVYRGRAEHIPEYLCRVWERRGITDQVVFGDRRPVHRRALLAARRRGIRNHVFEEGYFRPYWVTLEREGVNAHSLLPRDPEWFREAGRRLPSAGRPQAFPNQFHVRARHDVLYHLAGLANPFLHPHYRNHALVTAPAEYAGFLLRKARMPYLERRDAERMSMVLGSKRPFYLLPLQLKSDAQIRYHSNYKNMQEVIGQVAASFAYHAPSDARLVIKNHPLDMGLAHYARLIKVLTREYDLGDRLVYLEGGNLEALLRKAAGFVTVNSTAGNVALGFDCPTHALASPIYDMASLTHQGKLDDFWQNAPKPDAELFRAFRRTVAQTVQINGGFYCRPGIELASENALHTLERDRSPLQQLMDEIAS